MILLVKNADRLPVLNSSAPFFHGPYLIVRNSLENKTMIKQFVKRDFRHRYRGSILGYLWSLLSPLLQCAIYYLLIVLWRGGYERKPLWLCGGILAYGFFTGLSKASMNSLTKNIGLIKKMFFPREIFAISNLMSEALMFALSLLILIPLLIMYGFDISKYSLLFLLSTFGLAILSLGLGLTLCCANAVYKDIGMFMGSFFKLLFFASPILWRIEDFFKPGRIPPEYLDTYMYCNPLAVFLTMFRYGLDGVAPPITASHMVVAFSTSIVLLILGMCIFKKYEAGVVQSI